MSGRHSRVKGARTERSIVASGIVASGIAAVRMPLSGAAGGRFAGDIVLPLIVKADRRTPPVVVRLPLAAEVAKLVV
jgi:Holliday junction resolvase